MAVAFPIPRALRWDRHCVAISAGRTSLLYHSGFTAKRGFWDVYSAAMETRCWQVWEERDDEGSPALVACGLPETCPN